MHDHNPLILIGKSSQSEEWASFLARVLEQPDIVDVSTQWRFYIFKQRGIEFEYDKLKGQITTIFCYGDGKGSFDEHRKYGNFKDKLPGGTTVFDSREEIRSKLGSVAQSGKSMSPGQIPLDYTHVQWQRDHDQSTIEWDRYIVMPYCFTFFFNTAAGGMLYNVALELFQPS